MLDHVGRDLVRAPRALDLSSLPKPFHRISPKHITSHYSIHHLAKLACASRRSAFHGGHQPLLVEIPANYQRLRHSESRHTSQCILQLVAQVRHTDRCCIMAGSLAQRVLHSGGHHGLLDLRRGIWLPQSPSWVYAFLASSLGESRCSVLEALQNADEVFALTATTGVGS